MTPIEVRLVTSAPDDELEALYRDAGWWDKGFEENPHVLRKIVRESALFAGAFHKKKLVGMGRALSDLTSDAYIQDVVVLKTYRNRGIGKEIIAALITGLKEHGVDWIGLIGQPGTENFYRSLGFRRLEGHIPYKLEE